MTEPHDTKVEQVGRTGWRWVCSCGTYGPQVPNERRALDGAWAHVRITFPAP